MKKLIAYLLAVSILVMPALAIETLTSEAISIPAPHAILVEKETGSVIYEKSADERVIPASVTKVMTILLIVEALESGRLSLEDTITASKRACSMGGSQIYLAEGESMSARDMLKSIVVSSANDAAVAMAEHLYGTEDAFVQQMNERATELGAQNTNFNNCTGLFDDDDHYTSARDVALMSCELLRHEMIRDYTTIWMDTVRDGTFGLSNTNKLVHRFEGCTGLKTGYTSLAGHCLSASAERDGVEYIAVVMNCVSSEERFDSAQTLLNYAFANYSLVQLIPTEAIPPVKVLVGESGSIQPVVGGQSSMLLPKSDVSLLEYVVNLPESIDSPVEAGAEIGEMQVKLGDKEIAVLPLISTDGVNRRSPIDIFKELVCVLYGN